LQGLEKSKEIKENDMPSKLKAVDPKATEPKKPFILVFGKPATGKTFVSLDFPSVFFIDTEGGATRDHYTSKLKASGGMYLGIEQGSQDFDVITDQVKALCTEEHNFKTLIIDSGSKIFNMEVAKEADRLGDKDAFGASKKPAIKQMRRLMSWLNKLDMNIIITAFEKPLWAGGEQTGVTYDLWDHQMEHEIDLCLHVQKLGANYTARPRKSRLLGFPEGVSFPWSYEEFSSRYGEEIINRKSTHIALAKPEQVAEAIKLIGIVKLDENNKQDKWVIENQTSFDEVEEEKMTKIISYLKGKIA